MHRPRRHITTAVSDGLGEPTCLLPLPINHLGFLLCHPVCSIKRVLRLALKHRIRLYWFRNRHLQQRQLELHQPVLHPHPVLLSEDSKSVRYQSRKQHHAQLDMQS